jgi:outer membrane protein assembly factor BamE (lipoprotein component of BamABCDE complex)
MPSGCTRRRFAKAAAVLLVAFSTWSCQERVSTHGYIPDPEALSRIEPGVHNRLEVAQFLGSPSTTAMFGEETWLYITERRREFAFFKPEIVEQQVVAIAFDNAGVVDAVDEYLLADGLLVDPVTRTTPTYGKQVGLMEQLLGNMGRFNNEGGKGVSLPGQ